MTLYQKTALRSILCILGSFALSREVGACSVCYGDPDSLLSKGLTMGVLVLVAITGLVLSSFAYFFYTLWRKERDFSKANSLETTKTSGTNTQPLAQEKL